jgi:hypothetical protein
LFHQQSRTAIRTHRRVLPRPSRFMRTDGTSALWAGLGQQVRAVDGLDGGSGHGHSGCGGSGRRLHRRQILGWPRCFVSKQRPEHHGQPYQDQNSGPPASVTQEEEREQQHPEESAERVPWAMHSGSMPKSSMLVHALVFYE